MRLLLLLNEAFSYEMKCSTEPSSGVVIDKTKRYTMILRNEGSAPIAELARNEKREREGEKREQGAQSLHKFHTPAEQSGILFSCSLLNTCVGNR